LNGVVLRSTEHFEALVRKHVTIIKSEPYPTKIFFLGISTKGYQTRPGLPQIFVTSINTINSQYFI